MAIVQYEYCNAASGKRASIDFNDVTFTIAHGVLSPITCSGVQPSIISNIYSYSTVFGNTFGVLVGYLVPQNTHPYARYVPLGSECLLEIESIDVVNASDNQTNNGSITINAIGLEFATAYSIDGGVTFRTTTQYGSSAKVFTGLAPGIYNIVVKTGGIGSTHCTEYDTVEVEFDALVCNLALGSIQTIQANGSNGQIKIVSVTGSPFPVEYRLDAGAWQDSPEFTGLTAAVYNVQVRYKDYPCSDNRDVTISEAVDCDLLISYIFVTHEQNKYADDGSIQIVAEGSNSGIEYSIDDGDNYQASNSFYGLSPGTYNVRVRDGAACEDFATITIMRYKSATLILPQVNSNRFIVMSGPMRPTNQLANFDNTLFADERTPGVEPGCYWEKFLTTESIPYQFRSNYSTNTFKIYDDQDTLIATLVPVKKTLNLDYTEELDGFFANYGAGKTQIYFENGMPTFFEVGMDITITDHANLNGTYEIVDINQGTGIALGFQVLVIEANFSSGGTGIVSVTYDLEPYEVYEVLITWSLYGPGKYYMTIECSDVQFADALAQSEPAEVRNSWRDVLVIKYKNYENDYQIKYDTGIEHIIRVDGAIKWPKNPGERVIHNDSRNRRIKVEARTFREPQVMVYDLPRYLLERIALALDHDYNSINDIEYQTEDDFEPEYFENDAFGNGSATVRQVDFNNENSDDQGAGTVNDVDVLGEDFTTLLGVT